MGLPVYHVERTVLETGGLFGDRCHIVYANGSYRGDGEIGELMADFRENDPRQMHFPTLAKRMEQLKYSDKEVLDMCKAMEITYQEGRQDGRAEGRAEGREDGIRACVSLMRKLSQKKDAAIQALCQEFDLTPSVAEEKVARYWI